MQKFGHDKNDTSFERNCCYGKWHNDENNFLSQLFILKAAFCSNLMINSKIQICTNDVRMPFAYNCVSHNTVSKNIQVIKNIQYKLLNICKFLQLFLD